MQIRYENELDTMKKDFTMEQSVKDVLVKKLEGKNEELKDTMYKAIHIMKYPRLMENAKKRMNYERVDITKVSLG